jgi:hypothetical protein
MLRSADRLRAGHVGHGFDFFECELETFGCVTLPSTPREYFMTPLVDDVDVGPLLGFEKDLRLPLFAMSGVSVQCVGWSRPTC